MLNSIQVGATGAPTKYDKFLASPWPPGAKGRARLQLLYGGLALDCTRSEIPWWQPAAGKIPSNDAARAK